MLASAKNKEQKRFFVHFQKLFIEGNVRAEFYFHTTCRRKINLGWRAKGEG